MSLTPSITSRLPLVGTTIFTVMSQLAKTYDAINLGQGFPDFPMSPQLVEEVAKAMRDGHNQYTHMNGYPLLRERIAEKVNNLYGYPINPETQITITPGGTYAIYTALTSVLQPGDEVIVFEPAYDSYIPNITINGAVPVLIPLTFPDYRIPWDQVRNKITPRTRVIMLNTPHNPTGMIWQEADMRELENIIAGTSIFVLSDEVYEHLIYDAQIHQSVLRYPALRDRAFVCFSFCKTYHCTGWKLGYAAGSFNWNQKLRSRHEYNVFCVNSLMQRSFEIYLPKDTNRSGIADYYLEQRNYLLSLLEGKPIGYIPVQGTYFQWIDLSFLNKQISDVELAKEWALNAGCAMIPFSPFMENTHSNRSLLMRLCFAKSKEKMDKGMKNLYQYLGI